MLTGTHPCDAPPRQGGGTSERQLVLCWSVCSGASYTVCGLCRRYVLYCVLLHFSSTWSRLVALPILRETSHHLWLNTLADTTVLHQLNLTASAVLLIGLDSGSSDLCLNSLLALTAGLLFSCADGRDCNRRAASSTSCNHSVHTFHWRCEGEVIVQGDEGPVCGVAQVVGCHGVIVGHQEREEEEEQQEEVEGDGEELKERCTWMACGWSE